MPEWWNHVKYLSSRIISFIKFRTILSLMRAIFSWKGMLISWDWLFQFVKFVLHDSNSHNAQWSPVLMSAFFSFKKKIYISWNVILQRKTKAD